MKSIVTKTKYLLLGVICLAACAMLLFPKEMQAAEALVGVLDGANNLTVEDNQGLTYVFRPSTESDTGYSTTVSIDKLAGALPEAQVLTPAAVDIVIPSSLEVKVPVPGEEEEIRTLSIESVSRNRYYGSEVLTEEQMNLIHSITFAEGIESISGFSDVLNQVENISLPDTLNRCTDSIYGEKSSVAVEEMYYPNGEVPAWVQSLADDSEDHIAYAGTVALWVDPTVERSSLTFKEGTTSIAWFAAMGNTNITSATIPETVEELGDGIFYGCVNLTAVDIQSDRIPSLPYIMFTNTKLSSIEIPASVEKIAAQCFYKASELKTVTFAENSKCNLIDYRAFFGSGLTSIEIPASVQKIPAQCFYNTSALQTVTFAENSVCELIDYQAFFGSGLTSIEIPASVEMIAAQAFRNATALKSVIFEDESKCEKIDYCAFKNCPSLEAFKLPDSVTEIGALAFMGCTSLKTFEISDQSKLKYIGTGAFGWLFYKDADQTTYYVEGDYPPTYDTAAYALEDGTGIVAKLTEPSQYGCPIEEINIPYGVDMIQFPANCPGLFAGNTHLKSVTFQAKPEGINSVSRTIDFKCFYGCTALETVHLNGSISKINANAFTYCNKLQSIDLTGVTSVDYAAFADTGLKGELIIPESLTNVATNSFAMCPGIDKITINSTLANNTYSDARKLFSIIGTDCRNNISGAHQITLFNDGKQQDYQIFSNADYRKAFPNQTAPKTIAVNGVKVGEEIESALDSKYYQGGGLLQYMAMVEEVVVGDGVKEIAMKSCFGCVSLKTVTLPESIVKIGDFAFYNDERLSGIDFTKLPNLTTVGTGAFMIENVDGRFEQAHNEALLEELPKNWGLDEIVLSDKVTSIGVNAFFGQRNAKKIIVKSETAAIGNFAFQFCNHVEEIEVASGKLNINSSSGKNTNRWDTIFWNDRQNCLEKVTLSGASTIYGDYYWTNLMMEEADISSSAITKVEYGMFLNCNQLEKISLSESITSIEPLAFARCGSLKSIVLPASVEKLDIAAFAQSGLQSITILNKDMKFMKPVVGRYDSSSHMYVVDDPDTETSYENSWIWYPFRDDTTLNAKNTLPIMPHVTIYGIKGSTAETYANEHGNRFVALDYTISFDSNGGSEVESQQLSNMVGEETYVTEPKKPTKADSYFLGWFVKNEPETEEEEVTYTKFVFDQPYDSDMTVYAQWAEKDEIPATVPKSTISVANTVKTVGEVTSLPEGWSWDAKDARLALTAGAGVVATAEYTADDADAYKTTTFEVTITRAACEAADEIFFTGEGEYAPTCTKKGLGHRECSLCGDVVETGVEAPVIAHNLLHHDAEEASCIAYGAKEYWTCDMCHQMFADKECTKVIKVSDIVVDKSKHVPLPAVKENETDTSYDLVVYCERCQSEISRETVKKEETTIVEVKKLKLNVTEITLGVGETFKISASITPDNATDKSLTYNTSKSSVATVKNGKIVAKKKGSATITVTAANGKKATIAVTVKNKPKKVTLKAKSMTLKKGQKVTLKAELPKETASYKMTWSSDNKDVATVTKEGTVKALKKGTVKITVETFNGKKATCTIKVE